MEKVTIIDEYIGEILQLLDTTGGLLRDLKQETGEYQQELKEICGYIVKLWDLRERLYEQNPQIKQFELHKENIENKNRIKELQELSSQIYQKYNNKDFQVAYDLSLQLLEKAKYGHFKRIAEAILFCCDMQLKQCVDKSLNKIEIDIEELENLYQSAQQAENEQDFVSAKKLYEQLTRVARFSQYEIKGQAGIYRCLNANYR